MFFDISELIKKELSDIRKIIKAIESQYINSITVKNETVFENGGNECLVMRYTGDGIIYHKRVMHDGKRISVRLGGEDNDEVIRIKQKKHDIEILKVLISNQSVLEKVIGKLNPYDPESIDKKLDPQYRDRSGLVNKAAGIVAPEEWKRITKRNDYPLPEDSNVATDGMKTRSKSELIIYSIIKGYRVMFKYDMEIILKNDAGEKVKICPDFVILCNDNSLIIIEHLGKLGDDDYLANALQRIHLYIINGYKLNETLFLTADTVNGKINAEAVDELIRKMILPRAKRY